MAKVVLIVVIALWFQTWLPTVAWATAVDRTTTFRVYQKASPLKEFRTLAAAIRYGESFDFAYVEQIGTRAWKWDNFPRYYVYQNERRLDNGAFREKESALRFARQFRDAHVMDSVNGKWIWDNFARFTLYDEKNRWLEYQSFATFAEAKRAIGTLDSAHIVDLRTGKWLFDRYTAAQKNELRKQPPRYEVRQNEQTRTGWQFGYIGDAWREAAKWAGSSIVDLRSGQVIWQVATPYEVWVEGELYEIHSDLDAALVQVQSVPNGKLFWNTGAETERLLLWELRLPYTVLQNGRSIGAYPTVQKALAKARTLAGAQIVWFAEGVVWDNLRTLQVWAWNGSASAEKVFEHVAPTMGLDVDSPTWFILKNASGELTDRADEEVVRRLREQGIAVHPLVHNQFSRNLTTKFLANPGARKRFIQQLVARCVELQVAGVNIDFENVAGTDRAAFTKFMREITSAAHARKLTVSVDLPRGSVRWNALTAFDHEQLAATVDYIVTMTYDQHYSGSKKAGPVAGLPWVEEGIQEFLSYGIRRNQLLLGIPFYVRQWRLSGSGALLSNRALYMKDIPDILAQFAHTKTWDETAQQFKITYRKDGSNYVFWMENEDTVKARLKLAEKYELAGVAAWRLGYEPATLWPVLLQAK